MNVARLADLPAPDYPGPGNPCNQCGRCCLERPCSAAESAGLWVNGKCRALKHRLGKFWCDVAINPHEYINVRRKFAQRHKAQIRERLGITGECDAALIDMARVQRLVNQRRRARGAAWVVLGILGAIVVLCITLIVLAEL